MKLISRTRSIKSNEFDVFIPAVESMDLNKLHGEVLIDIQNPEQMASYLKLLELKNFERVDTVSFLVNDVGLAEKTIKSHYKVIKAAGGIVVKEGKLLMIHRLGVWDFPKGKIDMGEPASECAVREIEEECGVKAIITDKITSTWHTYTDKEKKILKKTTWYLMECRDDSQMKPQLEEQIDDVRWVTYKEAKEALSGSYSSVNYVLKKFKKMAEKV